MRENRTTAITAPDEDDSTTRSPAPLAILIVFVLALLAAGCGSASTGPSDAASAGAPTTVDRYRQSDFSGLVDIGGGRKIWTECKVQGSPTVVLISGHGNGAEDWSMILDPDDPAHRSPTDDVSAGMGKLSRSPDAVLPSVAHFTRACTYDRSDIRWDNENVTTPRPQPHTADLDVSDLHSMLAAIGEPGPFVFVAHSYGGLVATLYARTHPGSIAGLAMVDTASEVMEGLVTSGALGWLDKANEMTNDVVREGVMIKDAFKQINAAPPMPKVPALVLVADKPFRTDGPPIEGEHTTFADWQAMVNKMAAQLGAKKTITDTNAGHGIYLYAPALVTSSIHEIVDDVRAGRTTPTR